jgi:hypothetical protein
MGVSFIGGENHQPAVNHSQTLSHNVVSSTSHHEWDLNFVSASSVLNYFTFGLVSWHVGGHHGHDHKVVRFTTTCTIGAYLH